MCTGGCSSNSAHSWLSQGALWAEDTSEMPEHQVMFLHCSLFLIIFSEWLFSLYDCKTLISSIYNFVSISYLKTLYHTITHFIFYFEVEMVSIVYMWFWQNVFYFYRFEIEIEPLFATMALYDLKEKKKVSLWWLS